MTSATKPLALVTGVGPGTGASVARRFAEGGYRVAMLARDAVRLAALEAEIPRLHRRCLRRRRPRPR